MYYLLNCYIKYKETVHDYITEILHIPNIVISQSQSASLSYSNGILHTKPSHIPSQQLQKPAFSPHSQFQTP